MTTSRFGRTNRRRFVASSALGGAAILAAGQMPLVRNRAGGPAAVAQDDSSDVPMFRGNAARTGEMPGPGPDDSNGVEVLWTFETENSIWMSPAIADRVLYFGGIAIDDLSESEGHLYAVSSEDGTERWRFATGSTHSFSSPAIADGVVYVGGENSFHAVNAENGTVRWQFATDYTVTSSPATPDTASYGTVFSSPAAVVDVVYFHGFLKEESTVSEYSHLYAVDVDDGTERWRFATGGATMTSSPAIADGVVYIGGEDNLYAVTAVDGTERWRFVTSDYGICTTPVMVDGVVYISVGEPLFNDWGDTLFALNADDGTERWRLSTDTMFSATPAVAGGVVFTASSDGKLYALNADDGTERWRVQIDGEIWASPTVADHVVYAGCSSDEGATLYAINADDGTERWRFSTEDTYFSYPAVADGVVYVGSSDGNLCAIGARVPRLSVGGTARVAETTSLRGGPAPTAVERAELQPDTVVTITGESVTTGDIVWWPVTVDETGDQGWVEASKLEPLTSGPE